MRSAKLERGFKQMYKDDIANLQFALCVLSGGSFSGAHYDSKTKHEVKRFKKKEGLAADGTVDCETWTRILGKYRVVFVSQIWV